jgi:hypothetical protein
MPLSPSAAVAAAAAAGGGAASATAAECRYDIKCKMIDQAVSMDKNAGFTHWRSRIVNKVSNI